MGILWPCRLQELLDHHGGAEDPCDVGYSSWFQGELNASGNVLVGRLPVDRLFIRDLFGLIADNRHRVVTSQYPTNISDLTHIKNEHVSAVPVSVGMDEPSEMEFL